MKKVILAVLVAAMAPGLSAQNFPEFRFEWSPVTKYVGGGTANIVRYDVAISALGADMNTNAPAFYKTNVPGSQPYIMRSQFVPTNLPPAQYRLSVRPVDEFGNPGDWNFINYPVSTNKPEKAQGLAVKVTFEFTAP